MIPIKLYIAGFLSYRQPVELDLTGFKLACISGANGAGKSSLLDAITWALFGQARRKDDALIHQNSKAAEVALTFAYEGNVYRVQRIKPREKTTVLEFQVQQVSEDPPAEHWKALTEHTLRETEARIQATLRMDYDTFVNASFFLQGKADQFTQQRPGDRKRILGSILGLEAWEQYRQRAAERRKNLETETASLEGRLREIGAELSEEVPRRQRLAQLETDLERLSRQRQEQEAQLKTARRITATLAEQRRLVEALQRQFTAAEQRLETLNERQQARQEERRQYQAIIEQAGQIEMAYASWQAARLQLESMEAIAGRFRESEKRRQGPRDEIHAARAALQQELHGLQAREEAFQTQQQQQGEFNQRLDAARRSLADVEQGLSRRSELVQALDEARQRQAEARAENPRLRKEMDQLKERINRLEQTAGASCPLCGQPLGAEERQSLIDELNTQGREMGARYRTNQSLLNTADRQAGDLENQLRALEKLEAERRSHEQTIAQLNSRLEVLLLQQQEWELTGQPRQQQIRAILVEETYALEARQQLALIDAELKAIGYDAAAHDVARRAEQDGRSAEAALRSLESARSALAPLEREIIDSQVQSQHLNAEVTRQCDEYTRAAASLAAAEAQAPDLNTVEASLYEIQEQENRLRLDVGAARQKVLVLEDLKVRQRTLETRRSELAYSISAHKQLERAFGKDGVPALLIEQALPQIEARANTVLERLSNGNMNVRFVTQSSYKDKRREDLRETLEIQINDGSGTRDYEMFSGGEAFRVNFAIRLALSEVLAQRAGARLQTLVIDEGFGSQDAQGRQRLIEAINLVRPDFAKILVITHIDELKDAFPNRIEVEKTANGSMVRIV